MQPLGFSMSAVQTAVRPTEAAVRMMRIDVSAAGSVPALLEKSPTAIFRTLASFPAAKSVVFAACVSA
jgi:hypothetical protein